MGKNSAIAWTDHTFNPWWGCMKISDGCKNCYAEARQYGGDWWGINRDRRFFGDKHWNDPLRWNKKAGEKGIREKVFCGSYCDVFEDRPDLAEHRARLGELIKATPNVDWLLLTKRPENFPQGFKELGFAVPTLIQIDIPDNVWLGISVEDQETADLRIPYFHSVPVKKKFLSIEPLLNRIELHGYLFECDCEDHRDDPVKKCGERPYHHSIRENINGDWRNVDGMYQHCHPYPIQHVATTPAPLIDWVIVGGESGDNARPMHPYWARYLQFQCEQAGVPFFFKQWGEWLPAGQFYFNKAEFLTRENHSFSDGLLTFKVGKKKAGHLLDGNVYHQFPEPTP